jgi:hypothetical protein
MRIARLFLESDLRQGFQGLHKILQNAKINPSALNPEHYYIFMNRACTKFKLISGAYLVYFNNGNRMIPLDAIQYLPRNFGGKETEMNEAIRTSLTRKLSK